MSERHIVEASFFGCYRTETARRVYQYDYGQILKITGIDLPDSFEAHFSNSDKDGKTVTQIGTAGQVTIPDALLISGDPVYCFIVLHDDTTDGETVYKITIPVSKRPQPSDDVPTPAEESAITQAIAAANSAAEKSALRAISADNSATLAAGSAKIAAESATSAAESAESAEAAAEKVNPEAVGEMVSDYLEEHPYQETDPTVPAWAKQPTKPTYTAAEVGALPDNTTIPADTLDLTNGAGFLDGPGVSAYIETTPVIPVKIDDGDPTTEDETEKLYEMVIRDPSSWAGDPDQTGVIFATLDDQMVPQRTICLPDVNAVLAIVDGAIAKLDASTAQY